MFSLATAEELLHCLAFPRNRILFCTESGLNLLRHLLLEGGTNAKDVPKYTLVCDFFKNTTMSKAKEQTQFRIFLYLGTITC